ncbi:MAG: hypothetical protein ACKO0Z_07600 [Betaproteobacteria bacterium]
MSTVEATLRPNVDQRVYNVLDLYKRFISDRERFLKHVKGVLCVRMQDGSDVKLAATELILSMHIWQIMGDNNWIPLTEKCLVTAHYSDGPFGSGTIRKLLEYMIEEIVITHSARWEEEGRLSGKYVNPSEAIRFTLYDKVLKNTLIYNDQCYNHYVGKSWRFARSASAVDIYEVYNHPEIEAKRKNLVGTEESLREFDRFVKKTILTDPSLNDNNVAALARSNGLKMMQLLQMVGSRGFLTTVGSQIYGTPTLSAFAGGLNRVDEFVRESCSPGKSHYNAISPLEQGSYASRKVQIAAGYFKRVEMGDCGSNRYFEFEVGEHDLFAITGSYYLDPVTKQHVLVRRNSKHLIGQKLLFRNILAGCKHPNPNSVCSTCFGIQSLGLSPYAAAGINYSSRFWREMIQAMLSTKHHDGTASLKPVVLPSWMHDFVYTEGERAFFFTGNVRGADDAYITVRPADFGVSAQLRFLDINGFQDEQVASMTHLKNGVRLTTARKIMGDDDVETVNIGMKHNGKIAAFSKEFLLHVQRSGFILASRTEMKISLKGWDYGKPFALLPNQHYAMTAAQSELSAVLEGTGKNHAQRSPIELMLALHNQITALNDSKIYATFATLSAMIFPLCLRDPDNGDYGLPKDGQGVLAPLSKALSPNRSATGPIIYEQLNARTLMDGDMWNGVVENQTAPLPHIFDKLIYLS